MPFLDEFLAELGRAPVPGPGGGLLEQLGLRKAITFELPGGHSAFYGREFQDTEGSQSFTVTNGVALDQRLSFIAGSVIIENNTSGYINVPDATKDGTGRFVGPGQPAAFPILGHISRARINWQAPPGYVLPVANPTEQAQVIFFAAPIPPGLGTAVPRGVIQPTYSSSTGLYVVAASPTDIWYIRGSATKVVRVAKLEIYGSQTTAGLVPFDVRRRSTNDLPFASDNMIQHDTNDPVATAGVVHYTANPATLGTDAGLMRQLRIYIPTAATTTGGQQDPSGTQRFGDQVPWEPVTLRGQNQILAINLGGNTVAGLQVVVDVEFTELDS